MVILYQDCSRHLDWSKNMSARGRGLFSLYICIENFKNLLVRNHWIDFNIILQKCSFGNPLPRLFKPFGFIKKHGRQGVGLIFPIYLYRKLKKSSSETTGPISIYFCRNVPLVTLYQDCSSHLDLSKNMAARGRGSFFLYIYIKNLIIRLVRNHWTNCYIIMQNYSFVILYQDCSSHLDCEKNMAARGWGLFSLYIYIYLYRKLEKSSCQKPLDQFHYNLAKMFPW